ncbi:hypothetical protein DRP07_04790 [Archaeoglobales archaeon]|nr:MAG: hypothetical protein DRP07_04790 [Archaeoglobales archaeon]
MDFHKNSKDSRSTKGSENRENFERKETERSNEMSKSDKRIIPYIDKAQVKERVKKFLLSRGYSENEIFEDVVLDLKDTPVLIDLLVKLEDENKILILCDSPSETLTLTARLSTLIAKLLEPPARISVATNWMESEITDLLTGRTRYSLDCIPSKQEIKEMQNPSFDRSKDEKIKKVVSGLYSMKCRKCGLNFRCQ